MVLENFRRPVRLIPYAIRRALLNALLDDMVSEAIYGKMRLDIKQSILDNDSVDSLVYLAERAGIQGFFAKGDWGVFQSTCTDRVIFPCYAKTGSWSKSIVEIIQLFLKENGGTYLDIGANIGLTTVPIASNPNVFCIAIEPDPTNFANLTENVRRNAQHNNIEARQIALLDRRGSVEFSLSKENMGDHRIASKQDADRAKINVSAFPLDEVVTSFKGPLAIKMDAQGAEPLIIKGGGKVLNQASFVVLEFAPYMIDRLDGDQNLIYDYISSFPAVGLVECCFDDAPVPTSPGEAIVKLREAYRQNRLKEHWCIDVYADKTSFLNKL
ncbi:MAG: FkbM family methyltransferase [Pseudomonadota bacterium]|nr:FkbM family methyltransferase [Pseudomonadota bacterium]